MLKITIFTSLCFSICINGNAKSKTTNYIDSIKKNHKLDTPIILKLKPNESYSIIFQSKGCFHSFFDTLIISKKDSHYFATRQNKTTLLDSADIKTISKFEFYLQRNYKGNCTTKETYKVFYQNRLVRKIFDNSCPNYNFNLLTKQLFE